MLLAGHLHKLLPQVLSVVSYCLQLKITLLNLFISSEPVTEIVYTGETKKQQSCFKSGVKLESNYAMQLLFSHRRFFITEKNKCTSQYSGTVWPSLMWKSVLSRVYL